MSLSHKNALQNLGSSQKTLRDEAQNHFLHQADSVTFLRKALKSGKNPVGQVALLLGSLNDVESLSTLLKVANQKDLETVEVARVLRGILEIVDGQIAFNEKHAKALGSVGASSSPLVRGMVVNIYKKVGGIFALEKLDVFLNDEDDSVRKKAVEAVLAIKKSTSLKEVSLDTQIALLQKRNAFIKKAAITELKKTANTKAAFELFLVANDRDNDASLRADALEALANCLTGGETGLFEPVLQMTRENNLEIKAGALLCLGRLSDEKGECFKPILSNLLSQNTILNRAAAVALSEGFRGEHSFLAKILIDIFERQSISLATKEAILIALSRASNIGSALSERLKKQLLKTLDSSQTNISKTAIVILEGLYDDVTPVPIDVAKKMQTLLLSGNKEIRIASSSFLSKHGLR